MKRLTALLLAMIVAFGLTPPALAQALPEAGSAGVGERFPVETRQDFMGARGSSRFPEPFDTVIIKDGVFTITSLDVTIQMQVPFGWIGLTQDIMQQMMDYAMMADPLATLNYLIDNRISLLAVEPETSANLLAFVVADGFSAIVGDLDDEMLEGVQAAYGGEALTIGDRNYISVVEAGSLIFLTFYQGVRVGFELLMAGDAPTADETELLTEFVGAVAFL